ncbi:hypothetical protein V8G54_006099 [Vigna mungo]|uniref:Uncharacterized protein n=1 Tax=Vigna mungo TaxID=3915 RepID=A0AAQ3P1B5_VIGMU
MFFFSLFSPLLSVSDFTLQGTLLLSVLISGTRRGAPFLFLFSVLVRFTQGGEAFSARRDSISATSGACPPTSPRRAFLFGGRVVEEKIEACVSWRGGLHLSASSR